MTIEELRANYWRLHGNRASSETIERQIAMAQLAALTEIAGQLSEINTVAKRVSILNFEEIGLRLEEFFRHTQD